jgi:hypothetical protein
MTEEKWQQLVDAAKKNFSHVQLSTEDLLVTTQDGQQKQGTQDVLQFENASGSFKLVRENRPAVLEKKEHYSHRQGDTARVEYKVSDTDFSHKLRVYKEDSMGEWEEVTLDRLGL